MRVSCSIVELPRAKSFEQDCKFWMYFSAFLFVCSLIKLARGVSKDRSNKAWSSPDHDMKKLLFFVSLFVCFRWFACRFIVFWFRFYLVAGNMDNESEFLGEDDDIGAISELVYVNKYRRSLQINRPKTVNLGIWVRGECHLVCGVQLDFISKWQVHRCIDW